MYPADVIRGSKMRDPWVAVARGIHEESTYARNRHSGGSYFMNVFTAEHDIESILFQQVRPHGVLSRLVEAALCSVNRVPFLPPAVADVAYGDAPIPLKRRCEFPFFILARLLQSLAIQPHESACVVSAGAGYSATLLSQLSSSVEAFESDSVLFVRLIDATRGNAVVTPVPTLSARPVDVILMDGGSLDAIKPSVLDKLLPGGRIAFVRVMPGQAITLGAPLCEGVLLKKNADGVFLPPCIVCQLHLPRLNTATVQNEAFHF